MISASMHSAARTPAWRDERNRTVLVIWLLFTLGYLFAAWFKPFHDDEFYSWMYAWRYSFREILLLREFGIGHPPLYHLMQKCVQACMPFYHPLFVRTANYVVGSLFVAVWSFWCLKQKSVPLFCAGVCLSASVFEAFIFSRMWGLVILAVFMMYLAGERCLRTGAWRDMAGFGGACFFAFMADYGSSIAVFPYAAFVLAVRLTGRAARRWSGLFVAVLALLWLLTTWRDMAGAGLPAYLVRLVSDFVTIALKTVNVLFNFWFVEPFALALAVFGALVCGEYALQWRSAASHAATGGASLRRHVRCLAQRLRAFVDVRTETGRLALTVLSAWIMLLAVSPVFWRALLNKKYMVIVLPLVCVLLLKMFRPRFLNILALVLCLTGGIYLFSNRILEWYPPQVFDVEHPVVFENEFACANHYLRRGLRIGEEPVLVDFSMFEKYCKVCRIGTDVLDVEGADMLQFVGFALSEEELAGVFTPPPGFVLAHTEGVRLTRLDRLQFRYLTPIPKRTFAVYTFMRETGD
jgi:hypothetical protein